MKYTKTKKDLTIDMLRQLLHYDAETGHFFWREYRQGMSPDGRAGTLNSKGYWQIFIWGKCYLASRLAWFYVHGVWPKNLIDHIDGTRSNDALSNLREATHSENMMNRVFVGVTRHDKKGANTYSAQIHVGGKRIALGSHRTYTAAKEAYMIATEKYFGEFSGSKRLSVFPGYHF